MKYSFLSLLVLALILVSMSATCAPNVPATPVSSAPKPAETVAPKPKMSDAWEKLVSDAQKERQVSVYKGSPNLTRVAEGFKQKYGITLDILTLNPAEIAERMSRESRAGIAYNDVVITGYGGVRLLKPLGLIGALDDVIVLPEVLDKSKWLGGQFPMVDHYQVDFIGRVTSSLWINTEMVGPNEITQYRDLLNPRWKGKIVFDDPQASGAGTQWFRMYYPVLGDDYMKGLISQEPVVIRDKRLEVEWLARAKYPVLLAGNMETLVEFKKAGSPIAAVRMKEGDYIGPGSGTVEMSSKPAHPSAAKLFINWLLTREAQTLVSQDNLLPSLRIDVPTDHLDAETVPKPGMVYLADTLESIEKANDFMATSAKIFAPILTK